MATAVRTPRLNNNDDAVRLQRLLVDVGGPVQAGDPVAEISTDKAAVVIEATADGQVLEICAAEGDLIEVGSVLIWVGDASVDVARPQAMPEVMPAAPVRPTLKARLLLEAHGLDPSLVPASGAMLSVADVEAYLARRGAPARTPEPVPTLAAGARQPLSPAERSMARRVCWHRDVAVPGYIERSYDPAAWNRFAEAFQDANGLLFHPGQSLMAWRLAQIARTRRQLNATLVDDQKILYDHVNLGLTVQSPTTLYLVVVPCAEDLPARAFCDRVTGLQRRAMGDALEAGDLEGVTIAFSSMARWQVSRHMPILPPYTALIVAHSDSTLGATYDHRLLTGADAALLLEQLAQPPAEA
jgi:pyruvate/2-oxoglutarate dehydrogenase complex dihydrolipoamide acyltransferase (E2) component